MNVVNGAAFDPAANIPVPFAFVAYPARIHGDEALAVGNIVEVAVRHQVAGLAAVAVVAEEQRKRQRVSLGR